MVVVMEDVEIFLNKNVIVIHTDGSSAGKLIAVNENSIVLQKDGQRTLVSLSSIEKIKEKEFL